MRFTGSLCSMGLVCLLGAMAPGCFGSGDNEAEGRICASPIEGGKHCVSSNSGPSAAWNDAIAHGSEPIEMWAVWPAKVTLRQVVSDGYLLAAWLDDQRAILDFLRITKGSAESYQATMAGNMDADLERAMAIQNEVIREKGFDAGERFTNVLLEKGVAEVDPVQAEVAAEKQILNEVQAVLEKAQLEGAPFVTDYKALVDDFVAYRSTEAAETLLYTQWCNEASAADSSQLASVEEAIVEVAQKASAKPNDFLVAGMKLSAQILQFEKTTHEALAPHSDYFVNHEVTMPDLASRALRSISAMLGYAEQRVARSDATAKSLLLGAGMRRRALQLLADAGSPARTTMANALLAQAETNFAQSAQVQVEAMTTVQMSTLGLPYLAHRYDEHAGVLQLVPFCNAQSSSWRETGCAAMRPKFKDTGAYFKKTLSEEIAAGLVILKNKGVDAAAVEKVEQKLKSGDIKGAAWIYDVLLRSMEGT